MPPDDASADAGTAAPTTDVHRNTQAGSGPGTGESARDPSTGKGTSGTGTATGERTDCEDTLDLRLPDELIALFAEEETASVLAKGVTDTAGDRRQSHGVPRPSVATLASRASLATIDDDLLDGVADWGPIATSAGVFHLVPVRLERDLPLISRWMNDPAVAAFWELSGPHSVTEDHIRAQLAGDGRSVPCIGVLDGTPMSYWEIYRADLDPLARHYPARPHDTGIHLLIGPVAHRGRRLGSALLRSVADLTLDRRPACARVIAEPDLRNTASVSAFLSAGFRFSAEIDLPAKRAALMVRDRSLRRVL
ncbi:GNAT family N-acetyltransferase [Streptomyces bullii]|uniref:Lysine N-acyltransferase MbtK n=1 Tax=Streptomyces bullii TaxID=349910 RepID=A0ABW0UPF4_9ACTN